MKKEFGTIDMIHPTQCCVGYAEVAVKMEELSDLHKKGTLGVYLKTKIIPSVLGPNNVIYIVDHHHLGLALTLLAAQWQESNPNKNNNPYKSCTFDIINDFSNSKLSKKDFFKVLESLNLMYPFDENSERGKIPKLLVELNNDPYRSLAGFVRKSGGFRKINQPYLEFKWAEFFREHISKEEIEKDIKESVTKGIQLALSEKANHLPGWTGLEITKKLKSNFVEMINENKKKVISFNIEPEVQTAKNLTTITKPIKLSINKK